MIKVTYLLGAGASCNSLPLNSDLVMEVQTFFNECRSFVKQEDKALFEQTFSRVLSSIPKNASFDDVAGAARFNNPELHDDIKTVLWFFFSSISGRQATDYRYQKLLLDLAVHKSGKFELDPKVNFLSWNYDLQLEEALSGLFNCEINNIGSKLKIYPVYNRCLDGREDKDPPHLHTKQSI